MESRIIRSTDFWPYLSGLDWGKVQPFEAIVIHHSATPDNPKGYSWEAIRKYHIETNGWSDIGYHFGTELVGNEPQYLLGRSLYEIGSHAKNWNRKAIGICAVGNYDLEKPPDLIWMATTFMCLALQRAFRNFHKQELMIVGHRETYYPKPPEKSCPGTMWSMDKFRRDVGMK